MVRAPNWLGDNVLALPAVAALCRALPERRVSVLVREAMADFWRMTPAAAVLPFRVRPGIAGLRDRWRLAADLRGAAFTTALILPNSFDSALVPLLAGIPERVGWASDGRGLLLTRRIPFPRRLAGQSQSLRYQHLVATWLGGPLPIDPECRLRIAADVVSSIRAQRAELPPRLLAMNPGATYGTAKCWLPERYAALALEARRARDVGVIIVGSAGDGEVCARVAEMIAAADPTCRQWCRNLAGATTIGRLAAWLREAACLVTNDTGAMHIAAVVGTPLVAIFGPTDWRETAPLGTRHTLLRAEGIVCAPCCQRACAIDHRCMTAISVAQVWQAVQPYLDAGSGGAAMPPATG